METDMIIGSLGALVAGLNAAILWILSDMRSSLKSTEHELTNHMLNQTIHCSPDKIKANHTALNMETVK